MEHQRDFFQKNSNKTILGAIFTVLFIVMMFLIIYSYLNEYFVKDQYKVSYTYEEKYYEEKDLDKIYNDEKLYPKLNFSLDVDAKIQKDILITYEMNDKEYIFPLGKNYSTTQKISEFNLFIFYKFIKEAKGTLNCELRGNEGDNLSFNIFDFGVISMDIIVIIKILNLQYEELKIMNYFH